MELTRINNDVNGNPRYVVHFLDLLSNKESSSNLSLDAKYKLAVKKANTIGGKKYHTKSYGGGIVFQSYNTSNLKKEIRKLKQKDYVTHKKTKK